MPDQANRLRELITADGSHLPAGPDDAPYTVTIAGGKGGVGTTTIAVNLAIALAQDGQRVLLVDTNLPRGDVAAHCGLATGHGPAEVLAAGRTLHESIERGPAGVQVLAGRWGESRVSEWSPGAPERLLRGLRTMGPHLDCILLDVGTQADAAARTFWRSADETIVVTSPDSVAVVDSYAAIKTLVDPLAFPRIGSLVSHTTQPSQADDVHQRLRQACRRFLGIELRDFGQLSFDTAIRDADAAGQPLLVHSPHSQSACQLTLLAAQLRVAAGEKLKQSSTPPRHGRQVVPTRDH